ncbi:DUF2306 domain-containing protein [uncultured Pelagimonas sp.]|uniref:DUF2306 domain-containing protein n=1 Tax=uncultured Pelagimonas sp. TaxID=1618102 RepID=UPI00262A3623|nr:DUF2306 domain-containing protein [uncultured Pelagimonas sp.]
MRITLGDTCASFLPGLVFFLIGPLQFSGRLRSRHPALHLFLGRLYVTLGVASGLAVLWMVLVFPAVGGLLTQLGTFGVVAAMFACFWLAIVAVRSRQIARHRAFMIRGYALALSVSTARIGIDLSELIWGATFEMSFVPASIFGASVKIIVSEYVVRRFSVFGLFRGDRPTIRR